jgi:hypothetical protein
VPAYEDTKGLRRGKQMRALRKISITGGPAAQSEINSEIKKAIEGEMF